jgi:predicted acetyltransferase
MSATKKFEILLVPALKEDHATIQNLGRFYVYDMSRYCGFLKGWETPSNGLYECTDLSRYWDEPNRYPFLIKVRDELAGFVLVNKVGSIPEVDWCIGEFFLVSKFQGKGIGREVAKMVFDQFPGVWEVMQIPENAGAVAFWEKVVNQYAKGCFQRELKTIQEPQPHPMIVMKFNSNKAESIDEFSK